VNLLDSLLDAIVRLDGDALVMHVGEKPYVVTTSEARNQFRGPLAWGQVELSARVLTVDAVAGMLGQILPADQRSALEEYGATEYEVIAANHPEEHFTIVAARGGDDIWLEMRRRPVLSADATAVIANLHDEATVAVDEPPAEAPEITEAAAEVSGAPAAGLTEVPEDCEVSGETAEAPMVLLNEPAREFDESLAVESVLTEAHALDVSSPADEMSPEPLSVELDLTHLMDDHEQVSEESYSIDIDSDRDLAEELTSIDAEFEGGMLGGAQDWNDDVMTEGELGELLRATAAAVIAGEIGPEASSPQAGVAQAESSIAGGTLTEAPPALAPVAIVQPPAPEPIATSAYDSVQAPIVEPYVSRVTEELPLLVAYQIEHDRVRSQPPHDDVPPTSGTEEISLEESGVADVWESLEPVLIETIAVLAAESPNPSNEPGSPDSVQPEASAAAEAVDEVAPVAEEDRTEALASVTTDGDGNDEDVKPARPAAVVLPLTRQPKAEGGGEARVPVTTTLQRLLRLAAARGAGTVYVVANTAPLVRIDGEFSTLEGEPTLSAAFVDRLLSEVAPSARGASPSVEWLIDVPEIGRVRCVAFRDHRGPGVIFRMVPARAISADQLGLSAEVQALCSEADGLILVTGGRGSGKSTLLTSFVDLINRTRSDHIITTESQIDFVHEHKRSFISQREVRGEDAMVSALRAACREEPDVLIVEDLRTQELAALALDAAESGRLVFASVPGLSTPSALERLIEMFPAERREKVQASLAGTLRGIVSQVLLRKLRGGRVAAREVLINTPAVAGLIVEGKTFQLPAALENGRAAGMISFAESLASLVREGTVHPAHAHRKAPNRDQFVAALRRSGVDTAVAERLG
jgi:twitching motility protein PilT